MCLAGGHGPARARTWPLERFPGFARAIMRDKIRHTRRPHITDQETKNWRLWSTTRTHCVTTQWRPRPPQPQGTRKAKTSGETTTSTLSWTAPTVTASRRCTCLCWVSKSCSSCRRHATSRCWCPDRAGFRLAAGPRGLFFSQRRMRTSSRTDERVDFCPNADQRKFMGFIVAMAEKLKGWEAAVFQRKRVVEVWCVEVLLSGDT